MIIARNVPAIYFAMTDSKIFFYLCLSLIVGVFASSAFAVLLDFSFNEAVFLFICACLAVSGIILISVFWGQKNEIKIIPETAKQAHINKKTASLKEKSSKTAKAELAKTPTIKERQR